MAKLGKEHKPYMEYRGNSIIHVVEVERGNLAEEIFDDIITEMFLKTGDKSHKIKPFKTQI